MRKLRRCAAAEVFDYKQELLFCSDSPEIFAGILLSIEFLFDPMSLSCELRFF
jgi:hypothetical protein